MLRSRGGAMRTPFISPSKFQFDPKIIGIVAAGASYDVGDLVVDRLDRGGEIGRDRPVGSDLAVGPRPAPILPRGAGHGKIRLDIDGVGRRLPPLQPTPASSA